jgi:glycosyltransferase involved in cell wall biosynthesis
MEIRFSVIIPTCDRPELLREAVGSVLRQTYRPEEILIVDNGRAPVNSVAIPSDSRLRLVRALPRFGVSQARNLGAILAKGTHLAFLDDDDCWVDHYLEIVRRYIEQTGADVVLGQLRSINEGQVLKVKSELIESSEAFRRSLWLRNPGVVGSNTVVSRFAFQTQQGYDPYLTPSEDKAMVLDLLNSGFRVVRAVGAWTEFRIEGKTERLTELRKRVQGRWRFLLKYWRDMPWGPRLFNLAQVARFQWWRILGRGR